MPKFRNFTFFGLPDFCICETTAQNDLQLYPTADQCPCFSLHGKYKPSFWIHSFKPLTIFCGCTASLCRTWSETLKTGILTTWLIFCRSPGGTPVAKKKLIKGTPGPDEPIYKSLLSNIQEKFKNARSPSPDGKQYNNAISPASALSPFEWLTTELIYIITGTPPYKSNPKYRKVP